MTEFSAQGGITIVRMRSGNTLLLVFDYNQRAMYQGVDKNTGKPTPDFTTEDAKRPIITPKASTLSGASVSVSNHAWKYNGATLIFNGASDGAYTKDSTGKFEINPSNGELKVIGNLANKDNPVNGIFEYSCSATSEGYSYDLVKSTEIRLQAIGATSYVGNVVASTSEIQGDTVSSVLTATLNLAGSPVSCYVKWFNAIDGKEVANSAGVNPLTVTKDNISSVALFVAYFYLTEADATAGKDPVAKDGTYVYDLSDMYKVMYYISSENKTVDVGKDVTVTGYVVNTRTNQQISLGKNAAWNTRIMDKNTWEVLEQNSSNSITVTTNHTDTNNGQHDVEVTGSVSW